MTGKMKLCAMTKGGSGNPCFQVFFGVQEHNFKQR